MKTLALTIALSLLAACSAEEPTSTSNLNAEQRKQIAERIRPYGAAVADPVPPALAASALPVEQVLPGQGKYQQVCVACHGSAGEGGVGPALQGKGVAYISQALTAYAAGETLGPQSALMWGQAAGLSDQDIQDLAEYISTL
jgi:cytochrome c553